MHATAEIILPVSQRDQNRIAFELGGAVGASTPVRGAGSRYADRYAARYGVGQGTAVPTGGGPTPPPWVRTPGPGNGGAGGNGEKCRDAFVTSSTGAGHGRRVVYFDGKYSCEIRPPKCDCHVIGGNTLNRADLPTGIASGAFADIVLDSGDADFFLPYYMHIIAFQTGNVANLSITGAPLLVLLQDSRSGQNPNLRRASATLQQLGIATLVYGQEKDLECVDWERFSSQNRQQLTLRFFNPNEVAVHIFVDLWGIPGVK